MKYPKYKLAFPGKHALVFKGHPMTQFDGYTLGTYASGNGIVSANKTKGFWGESAELFQSAADYYTFDGYSANKGTVNGNTYIFGKGNDIVTAFFNETEIYNLFLNQTQGGTITGNPMTGHSGQYIVLSALPSSHYTFNGYSVTGGVLSGDKIIIGNSDITAQASWIEDQKYSLTITQTNGGIVTSNKSTGYQGDQVTLSNTPSSHYTFDSYNITGATLTGNKFNFVNKNVTAKGTFIQDPIRSVILQKTNGGTITANPMTGYDGTTVVLTNTSNNGYAFSSYSVTGSTLTGNRFNLNGSNVTAKGTFYINSNRTAINSGYADHAYTAVGCNENTMSAWDISNARIFGFKYTFQISNSDYNYAGTEMYINLSGGYLNNSGRFHIEDEDILTVKIPGLKVNDIKYPPLNVGVLVYSQSAQTYTTQWDDYWDKPGTAWHSVTPSFYMNTSNNKVSKVKSQIVNPDGASEITEPGDYYVYNSNWRDNPVTLNYIFEEKQGGIDNLYVYADNTFVGSSISYYRKHNLRSNYWSYIHNCGGGAARLHVNYFPWDSSGKIDYIVYSADTLQDAINA